MLIKQQVCGERALFGIFRTILATDVIADHFAGAQGVGVVAVFAFFTLSGFLMTLLMTGPYQNRPGAFFLNRFLRLYPLYWATLGLAIALDPTLPYQSMNFLKQAIFIVRYNDNPIFVPTAWAVTNELVFYVIIGFGASKTLRRSLAWLIISSVMTAAMAMGRHQQTLEILYFPVWCATLPFSLGAAVFHLRDRISIPAPPAVILSVAAALNLAAMAACTYSFYHGRRDGWLMLSVYLSLLPDAAIVLTLYRLRPKRLVAIDEQIGRLSYPIYLMQFLGMAVALRVGLAFTPQPSLYNAATVLAVTLALSIAFLILIDGPVQTLRKIIRRGGDAPKAALPGIAARLGQTVAMRRKRDG